MLLTLVAAGEVKVTVKRLFYPLNLKSISTRSSLLVLVVASACMGLFFVFTAAEEERRMAELASKQTDVMAKFVKRILLSGMKEAKPSILLRQSLKDTDLIARFRNTEGRVVFSNVASEKAVEGLDNCVLGEVLGGLGSTEGYTSSLDEYVKIIPLASEGECAGCHKPRGKALGSLEIRIPTRSIRTLIHNIHVSLVIAGGVCIIAIVSAVLMLYAKLFGRLDILKDKMRQVGSGDLSAMAPEKPLDEIGELGRTFNSLVRQLQSAKAEVEEAHQKELKHLEHLVAVGELATGVVHELKNPLAAVSATVQSLRKDIRSDDPNAKVFDQIVFEVNAASSILQNLLQFGKQSEPILGPTNLGHCVKEVLAVMGEQTRSGDIEIDCKIDPNLPEVQADARLLQQVLLNIIMNAIQAKQKGLHLEIDVSTKGPVGGVLPPPHPGIWKQKEVGIKISDNGPGIHPNNLERIFRPFFTTRPKGTGLGLAISRTIVEKHGGTISVESTLGKGATFTIQLPVGSEIGQN